MQNNLWKTIERPGYFGAKRDLKYKEYNETYGEFNWRLAWKFGEHIIDNKTMYMLYEDAYFHFLKNNSSILEELVTTAEDVYDDALTNVHSRYDYLKQETDRTHVQDISIRRCVLRLGRKFQGSQLLQIRDNLGTHPLSMILSPGQIPFHYPELIEQPELKGWWKKKTVESFYQSNKILQAK